MCVLVPKDRLIMWWQFSSANISICPECVIIFKSKMLKVISLTVVLIDRCIHHSRSPRHPMWTKLNCSIDCLLQQIAHCGRENFSLWRLRLKLQSTTNFSESMRMLTSLQSIVQFAVGWVARQTAIYSCMQRLEFEHINITSNLSLSSSSLRRDGKPLLGIS